MDKLKTYRITLDYQDTVDAYNREDAIKRFKQSFPLNIVEELDGFEVEEEEYSSTVSPSVTELK